MKLLLGAEPLAKLGHRGLGAASLFSRVAPAGKQHQPRFERSDLGGTDLSA